MVDRYFTSDGKAFDYDLVWEQRSSEIKDSQGNIIFSEADIECPASWDQLAVDIAASKYFYGSADDPNRERSIRQLCHRVVRTIADWGVKFGHLNEGEAQVFYDELMYVLLHQLAAPNSPVFFNCGAEDVPPVLSACFVLPVEDTMESILELQRTEAMIFKSGGGAGVNLSPLRSSREAIGGSNNTSSGPVVFMEGYDAYSNSLKSGGRKRRAALMQILNADHPDILQFIDCKSIEEEKARILAQAGFPPSVEHSHVKFQNCNLSVRVTDAFMKAAQTDGDWDTHYVKTGEVCETLKAREVLKRIASGTRNCGDPALQFDDTINAWNTVKNSGRITATNPCQPGFAKVITMDGLKTFDDVSVGSVIWTGSEWTTVVSKVATGIKPVYRFQTTAGAFVGTSDHQVFEYGKRCRANDATEIDICVGPVPLPGAFQGLDPQDIMDGWVLGDGSIHKASNNLVHLNVGSKDGDIHGELGALLVRERPGLSPCAWEVQTTISAAELPRTWDRRIPDRFVYGDPQKVCGFLRGLYSANGSICGGRVTLKASSLTVITQVQEMLSSVGVPSYFTTNKPHDVTFSNGTYRCRRSYDLNITHGRDLFAKFIGFVHKGRTRRLEEALAKPKQNKKQTSYVVKDREYLGDLPVYDITVSSEDHAYWTGGLRVSNCAEYCFLGNSACNLASINLLKFLREDGTFDTHSFCHVVSLLILAMDIIVEGAAYPTEAITANSKKFRPLGLGYTNLGALLMSLGLPYDSDEARAIAASVTALMTGQAYAASAKLAAKLGAFEEFATNKKPMMEVINRHQDHLEGISQKLVPNGLLDAVKEVWAEAISQGRKHGFRNAVVTLIAPTGTISFLMGAATTGIEPDYSLVKHKRMVGGGTRVITNGSVPQALARLGYSPEASARIVEYILANSTVEGAPGLAENHLAVFDCAARAGLGKRSIAPLGHIKAMAAVQPFLGGAISKTVNCPNETTVDQIMEFYLTAWRMGLKSIAIYRDGSKTIQPLSSSGKEPEVRKVYRRKLPSRRNSITLKFEIGGSYDGYLTIGLYEDGTPGEIFINMSKAGSTVRGMMDALALVVSIALQYGVPLEVLVEKLSHVRFEPYGMTNLPEVRFAKSPVDLIFRWMSSEFLGKEAGGEVDEGAQVVRDTVGKARDVNSPQLSLSDDSPPCPVCGSITFRSGNCYLCNGCGSSTGCS